MSDLKLYNTLTREKQVFVPEDEKNVRMYVCGPTVYDFAHIGNARPVIVFDVLYRLLRHKYGEQNVTYVRNITDVDDKINARALRDYPNLPLNDAIKNVTEKTATQFHADVKALGCLEPTHEPRATEHIDGMVSIIQTLLDKDHAYVADGTRGREVLFDISKMDGKNNIPKYGVLSNRNLDEQKSGARVEVELHKRNAGDFVLWKQSVSSEPGWQGEFTPNKGYEASFEISEQNRQAIGGNSNVITIHGRPGWHIECSAMSEAFLGKTFDIHGGGLDLIFPHHENEIAQSCCAHGTDKMANVWMHNGYVQVEGKKMSKSDGNFITIHDLLHTEKFGGRSWPGEVLRMAMLMTHYREPIDFSVKRLKEAYKELRGLSALCTKVLENHGLINNLKLSPDFLADIPEVSNEAVVALSSDLNFSEFIKNIRDLRTSMSINSLNAAKQLFSDLNFIGCWNPRSFMIFAFGVDTTLEVAQKYRSQLDSIRSYELNGRQDLAKNIIDQLVASGVKVSSVNDNTWRFRIAEIDETQIGIEISKRLELLNDKYFAEADRIRDELLEQGIQLKDGKDPETGERVTTWEVKR